MGTVPSKNLLSETLFSRNRSAVLGLLYGHPDQDFYLRQIVRAVAGGHGAIQRELKQLTDAEIVRRFCAATKSTSRPMWNVRSFRNSRPSSLKRWGWPTC